MLKVKERIAILLCFMMILMCFPLNIFAEEISENTKSVTEEKIVTESSDPSVKADAKKISIKKGESKENIIKFKNLEYLPEGYFISYGVEFEEIAECEWGEKWTGNSNDLIVSGKNPGNTRVVVAICVPSEESEDGYIILTYDIFDVEVTNDKGDIDGDGSVTILDARLAKRIAMKDATVSYTDAGFKAGDLDGNGKITINEARKTKRVVLGETKY